MGETRPDMTSFVSEPGLAEEREFAVPAGASLEDFLVCSQSAVGLELGRLAEHDLIHMKTQHSQYRISLLEPDTGRATVEGGAYFSTPTEAIVRGATLGGATLKIGWLGIGLQVEFVYQITPGRKQTLVTSAVSALQVERAPGTGTRS